MTRTSKNKISPIRTIIQLALGLTSIALLQQTDLLATSGVELLVWLLLLAIPLAVFSLELKLFTWRAALKEATEDGSASRSLLWWGTLRKLFTYIGSLLGAGLILILTQELHHYYWYLLYGLVPVVLVIYVLAKYHWLQGEVRGNHQPLLGRQLALLVVSILLTLIFTYLAYYHVGVPDLRANTLQDVVSNAFSLKLEQAESPLIGAILGVIQAVSDGTWFLMQVISGSLTEGPLKVAAWLLFLTPAALQALLIVRLQLGLFAIVEYVADRGRSSLRPTGTKHLFVGTFFGLVIMSTWLGYKVQTADLQQAGRFFTDAATRYDPCQSWSTKLDSFTYDEQREIEAIVAAVQPLLNEHIKVKIFFSYKRMDPHLDNYLDWYYSHGNQFFMQWIYIRDKWGDTNLLTKHLNANLERHIWLPYRSSILGSNASIATKANELLEAEFTALAKRMADRKVFLSHYQGDICLGPALLSLEDAPDLNAAMAGSTNFPSGASFVTGAVAAKMVSKKLATAIGTKTTAKIIGKMGLNLSAKAVTAGSTVVAGASAGAFCGPAAPFCAVVGGVGAAVAFEIVFNEADELFTRADAKAELKLGLLATSRKLELAYLEAYETILQDAVTRTFSPDYVPADN